MRVMQTTFLLVAITVIVSCTYTGGALPVPDSDQITTEMLLDESPLAAGKEPVDLSQIDILELSPEMINFMDRWVEHDLVDYFRLRRLLYALMGDGTFNLIYEDSTRTAQETFRDQRGNCLSFTNMFVAMSRHLGLESNFQEVSVPPDWSVSGETFVFNLHINAQVELESYADQMVDFNMYDFRLRYDRQIVSDSRARAHYFNNMGVEAMLAGDNLLALANFRESFRADDSFSATWINLGTLYKRIGHRSYAEAAYLKALSVDDDSLVAMSNLAAIYEEDGKAELAEIYGKKVKYHRSRNPYYHYQLARIAFGIGDYETAIGHLKTAIRKNKNEDMFYFLMSLSYHNSGDNEAAQRWMKKAEKTAEMVAEKQKYHRKLDMLMSGGTGG